MIFLAMQNPGRFLMGISNLAVNFETDVHSLLILLPNGLFGDEGSWNISEETVDAIKLQFSSFSNFCASCC